MYNCQTTVPKSAQILPPGCEKGFYGGEGLFVSIFTVSHLKLQKNVSPYFVLLKHNVSPFLCWLDAHSIVAMDTSDPQKDYVQEGKAYRF